MKKKIAVKLLVNNIQEAISHAKEIKKIGLTQCQEPPAKAGGVWFLIMLGNLAFIQRAKASVFHTRDF